MGTGFWIIQAMLLAAAIATAVYVERQHHRDERDAANAPHLKIHIQPRGARHAGAPAPRAAAQFTLLERSRLLVLRGWVQEARAHQGRWYDDLGPDESHRSIGSPPVAVMPPDHRASVRPRWSGRRLVRVTGVALLAFGCFGIWRTNTQMDSLERAQQAIVAMPKTSSMSRLVPGVIASPAKYLGAVNSSSGSISSGGDPLAVVAMLDLKQAMDRYEAVLLFGLALLVGSMAGWPPTRSQAAMVDGAQQSSIASDLVPFIAVAALLFAALSFFELP